MSSEKSSDMKKSQAITRKKQSRRKLLKSMAAGSGAIIAGKSTSDQWSKPMIDSVLLPVHAQTSPPLACSVTGTVSGVHYSDPGDSADNGLDATGPSFGPFSVPGDYNGNTANAGVINVVPSISVTPGVTDGFNLTTVPGNIGSPNGADLNQNVNPDPANGALAFNSISTYPDWSGPQTITMTLTPDNSAFCGGPLVIDITFGTGG